MTKMRFVGLPCAYGMPNFDFPCPCGRSTIPFPSALAGSGFRFAILLSRATTSLFRCFQRLRFNAALFRQNGMVVALSLLLGCRF
jgi:hypothetical protein